MNTREEILDAMSGQGKEVPPAIFTQTGTVGQMESCGTYWPDAIFDASKMATLSLQLHRQFGFATAKVPFCITAECDTLGCRLGEAYRDRQPAVIGSPYRDRPGMPDVPDFIDPNLYAESPRLSSIRDAAQIVSKTEKVFTIGGCIDPATAVMQLIGADDYLVGTIMEPRLCLKWINALIPHFCEEVKRLSECVDDVQIIALSDTNLTPPKNFEEFIGKSVHKMISSSSCMTTLHSCGNTMKVLDKLCRLGIDGLSVESHNRPHEIVNICNHKVRLLGGINPIETLLLGTEKNVMDSAKRYSEEGYDIIAPECGVPPLTPDSNLLALSQYRNY